MSMTLGAFGRNRNLLLQVRPQNFARFVGAENAAPQQRQTRLCFGTEAAASLHLAEQYLAVFRMGRKSALHHMHSTGKYFSLP